MEVTGMYSVYLNLRMCVHLDVSTAEIRRMVLVSVNVSYFC
jgi:hypothetical protein